MKALILYTNTGAGHVSAGKALCHELRNLDIETIELDTLSFAGKSTSKKIENSYVSMVKYSPRFFGLLYKAGEKISNPRIKSIIYILNSIYSNKLYNVITKENPDIIICTHIFCAQTISHLKNKYSFNSITSAIITDYTCAPFWEETNLDYYFIPHKDLLPEFIDKGINKNKLYSFGLPVHSKFSKHVDKIKAKKELNLNPNMNHILIMGGSMGAGHILETVKAIYSSIPNIQITAICGHNEDLFNEFNNEHINNDNIKILQFTNSIDLLMDATDILITKPGGLTSTEAMTKNLPIIMINPIPGVESANSLFFKTHGMALASNSIKETIKMCNSLLNDFHLCDNMIKNQKENINSNSAFNIASFLIQKAKYRRY